MRKNLSGWLLGALAVAVTLAFVACKGGVNEPTRVTRPEMDDDPITMIEGYVTKYGTIEPIANARVWAEIQDPPQPAITIGQAWTMLNGYYAIQGYEDVWVEYEGLTIHVYAEHEDYETGHKTIPAFSMGEVPYRIDFELVPK